MLILPFYKTRARVRLPLPVKQESAKSLKRLLVLNAKTFEMSKTKYYACDYRSVMNVNVVILCMSVWSPVIHIFRSFETYSLCYFVLRGICLSTFSHDGVRIFACPESITGGSPNCKTEELVKVRDPVPVSMEAENYVPPSTSNHLQ